MVSQEKKVDKFFFPESVVVVGVSSSHTNLARRILINLKHFGFRGHIYAAGPRDEEVEGFKIYKSVMDIEEIVDLAIVLTPAAVVPQIAEECGRKGIKRMLIESGGFGEFEGDGCPNEKKLLEICQHYGIRFVGPNCIGIVNRENGLCTPFARMQDRFVKGGLSAIAQSGGVGASFLMDMTLDFVGVSKFASFGNAIDVKDHDLINYLSGDPDTHVIAAYFEGISDGRKLLETASRVEKPIVVLKSNRHQSSKKIACSHSAALAGDDRVTSAAFKQAGVLRAPDYMSWTNITKQLFLPPIRGKRLAVLSRSGGHAVLAADAIDDFGFELPVFPQSFFEAVKEYFQGGIIKLQNPLDLGQIFFHPILAHIIEEALKLDEVDGVLFIHTYDAEEEGDFVHTMLGQIPDLIKRYNKPVTVVLHTQHEERSYVRENFRIPVFRTPLFAVEALYYSGLNYHYINNKKPWPQITQPATSHKTAPLLSAAIEAKRDPSLSEALTLCEAAGFKVAPWRKVVSIDEALKAAAELGFPLALKLCSAKASHKTDVGGVQLNIKDNDGLKAAWTQLEKAAAAFSSDTVQAVLQKMSAPGVEMIVGGKTDDSFGPVVLVGSGGIMTELLEDVSVRVAPIDNADAAEMLEELKGVRMLKGFRGFPPADIDALADLVSKVAHLMNELEAVAELDLNPVMVHARGEGVSIVDARIILKKPNCKKI